MTLPASTSRNIPPGLESLSALDQLLVIQKVELVEAITGFETNNRYVIKDNGGNNIYFALEDTDCCTRNCCGASRPFDMKILDNSEREVIHLFRPLACDSCCFPCCLQSIDVSAPPRTAIGSVQQQWTICKPNFAIKNAQGEVVLWVKGPCWTMSCYPCCHPHVDFGVFCSNGQQQIGKISKQWSGFAREIFTDADFFGISFPMDLDVRMKAVMLGALFLIDFMFFEI